jgi:hypothetical protein
MEDVKLTREDLYERVWAEPMRTLAQRYGLSDVGLAKTCKRLRVPVPGRGYWARKAAGHKVKQLPLPLLLPTALRSERGRARGSVGSRGTPNSSTLDWESS